MSVWDSARVCPGNTPRIVNACTVGQVIRAPRTSCRSRSTQTRCRRSHRRPAQSDARRCRVVPSRRCLRRLHSRASWQLRVATRTATSQLVLTLPPHQRRSARVSRTAWVYHSVAIAWPICDFYACVCAPCVCSTYDPSDRIDDLVWSSTWKPSST